MIAFGAGWSRNLSHQNSFSSFLSTFLAELLEECIVTDVSITAVPVFL